MFGFFVSLFSNFVFLGGFILRAIKHQGDVFVELSVVAMRFLLNSDSKLSMYEMRIVFLWWIKLQNLYPMEVVLYVFISSNLSLL